MSSSSSNSGRQQQQQQQQQQQRQLRLQPELEKVECPLCGSGVPGWLINQHIDGGCKLTGKSTVESDSQLLKPRTAIGNGSVTSPLFGKVARDTADSRYAVAAASTTITSSTPTKRKFNEPVQPPSSSSSQEATFTGITIRSSTQSTASNKRQRNHAPLAEQLRPTSFDTFFGQQDLVSPTSILRRLIEQDRTPSMILWGPTASGKTSLARIIARTTNALFKELSAVVNNTGDVKKVVDDARNVGALTGQRTILFVDEIHRFNKAQQEVLLPHIESGTIVFIGATTENPSFKLTTALLSRCRVFVLHKLDTSDIEKIVKRAINLKRDQLGIAVQNNTNEKETIPASSQDIGKEDDINKGGDTEKEEKEDNEEDNEEAVVRRIARIADGDARVAINLVDMALDSTDPASALTSTGLSAALKRTHMMYDRVGDSHYDTISAFHKSIRGSDDNAALYWLTRMLTGGEDPLYIARRMIRIASEDIGLADNNALQVAVSAYNAVQFVGMPECDVSLAHCAVYLARAPKSVEVYKAFKEAKMAVADNLSYPIPIHLRNAPTGLMKSLGYGAEYKYNPDYDEPVEQDYLPPELKHLNFFIKK